MKDAILVKILVEKKALVKLLKTIGRGREYATRALLTKEHMDTDTNCF